MVFIFCKSSTTMIIFVMLLQLVLTELIYKSMNISPHLAQSYSISSIKTEDDRLVIAQTRTSPMGSTFAINHLKFGSNFSSFIIPVFIPNIDYNAVVRIAPKDTNKVVLYTYKNISVINLTSQTSVLLNFSILGANHTVRDICLGDSNQIIVIATLTVPILTIYNNSINPQTQKNISLPLTQFDKMICKNNKIYLSFTQRIVVYSMDDSLTFLGSYWYFPTLSGFLGDFQVGQDIIVYSTGSTLVIINQITNSTIYNLTQDQKFTGVKIIDHYQIAYVNLTHLIQYDYQINQIISVIPYPYVNTIVQIHKLNNLLILSLDYSYTRWRSNIYYTYQYNSDYICVGCSTCRDTYKLDSANGRCVKNLVYNLDFYITRNDKEGLVQLTANTYILPRVFYAFSNNYQLYFDDQIQQRLECNYQKQTGQIIIKVFATQNTYIENIQIRVLNPILTYTFLQISIKGTPTSIYVLSQKLSQKIQQTSSIAIPLINNIARAQTFIKTFFFSFFIMSFINFYSIILLYNFLCLTSQPSFSLDILNKFSSIFFQQSLFIQIKDLFQNSQFDTLFNIGSFVNQTGSRERIVKSYGQYRWFGDFGISYDFVSNNMQSILIMGFLLIRLIIFKILFSNILSKFINKKYKKIKVILQIFLSQLICSAPLMIISAMQSLLKSGYFSYKERLNLFLHVVLTFFIIISPFILFLLDILIKKQSKVSEQLKKSKAKFNKKPLILKIKRRFSYKESFKINLQNSLNIIIPILIVLRSKIAFFTITTLWLTLLFFLFLLRFKTLSLTQKIFGTIRNLILISHHFSFLILFIAQILEDRLRNYMLSSCLVVGVIIILTVLIGLCSQILEIVCNLFVFIFKKIRKCLKKKRNAHDAQKNLQVKPLNKIKNKPKGKNQETFIKVIKISEQNNKDKIIKKSLFRQILSKKANKRIQKSEDKSQDKNIEPKNKKIKLKLKKKLINQKRQYNWLNKIN